MLRPRGGSEDEAARRRQLACLTASQRRPRIFQPAEGTEAAELTVACGSPLDEHDQAAPNIDDLLSM